MNPRCVYWKHQDVPIELQGSRQEQTWILTYEVMNPRNLGSHALQKVLTVRHQQDFQPIQNKGPANLFFHHHVQPAKKI